MDTMVYCQSCAMPLDQEADYGTNADGTKSTEYCHYCYEGGAFTQAQTMDEMIEACIPFVINGQPYNTEEEARAAMQAFFPSLKRWK